MLFPSMIAKRKRLCYILFSCAFKSALLFSARKQRRLRACEAVPPLVCTLITVQQHSARGGIAHARSCVSFT